MDGSILLHIRPALGRVRKMYFPLVENLTIRGLTQAVCEEFPDVNHLEVCNKGNLSLLNILYLMSLL